MGGFAVKLESRIGLCEMEVGANLDRPVSRVGDFEGDCFFALVDKYFVGGVEDEFTGNHVITPVLNGSGCGR